MMVRIYRCDVGHRFRVAEAEGDEPRTVCAQIVWEDTGEMIPLSTTGRIPTSDNTRHCWEPCQRADT